VGYAGGESEHPTYRDIGGHTESFQLIFDPGVITYEEILEVFWSQHDPYRQSWSTQYQSVAFYENPTQKKALEKSLGKLQKGGMKVATRIEPLKAYTLAEDYHQKHSLRAFPEFLEDLRDRSAGEGWMFTREATKLNGYLGNYGSCDLLEKEVRGLALRPALEERLLDIVCSQEGRKGVACPVPERK
jgi:methionine-S-sulfoxide reductase